MFSGPRMRAHRRLMFVFVFVLALSCSHAHAHANARECTRALDLIHKFYVCAGNSSDKYIQLAKEKRILL